MSRHRCGGTRRGWAAARRRRRRRHRGRRADRGAGRAPRGGRRCVVLSKGGPTTRRRSTRRAGSPSCCRDAGDSVDAHVARHPGRRRRAVRSRRGRARSSPTGPAAVADLVDRGARFDESARRPWALHPRGRALAPRRIIHAGGDATGAEVQRALRRAPRRRWTSGATTSRCEVLHRRARRVTGVLGARAPTGSASCTRPSVLLATGGLGPALRGDHQPRRLAPATASRWRCGPAPRSATSSSSSSTRPCSSPAPAAPGRRPLITEAVRGEGAVLRRRAGQLGDRRRAPAGRPGPARRRGRGDRRAAARDRRPTTSTSTPARIDGFAARFPTVTAVVPGRRHRPAHAADPGRARRALQLRRRRDRRARPHRACPGCSPPARSRAPGCTAPTGWRPTACSRASSWAAAPDAAAAAGARPAARSRRARALPGARRDWTARCCRRDDRATPRSSATRDGLAGCRRARPVRPRAPCHAAPTSRTPR